MRRFLGISALGLGGLAACAGILGYDRATLLDDADAEAGGPRDRGDSGPDAFDTEDARGDVLIDLNLGDGSYSDFILAEKPIAYWPLDEVSGATIATDVVGGKNAQIVGAVTFVDAGVAGNAASFGSGGTLDVGDNFDFPGTTTYSVEAWAQPNTTATFANIAVKHLDGAVGFALYYKHDPPTDIVEMEQRWLPGHARFCSAPVNPKVLSHIVLTYQKGPGPEIFLNGRVLSAVPGHDEDGGPPDTLDPFQWATGYIGLLDELAIYDHVLTPAQIDAHYRKGIAKP